MSAAALPVVSARTWPRLARPALTASVLALAAALRIAGLARTPLDPFYDAAVRSMGTSWHAFLVGAFEPSGRVAIDKPPLDLWLQVASTKLLGYGPVALLAPAALGGTLAVVALYDLLNTLAGRLVAVVGALALAVLPAAVISARSDTMDSAMAALVVGAWAVAARGRGRTGHAVAAGALIGLAFEVKLFEALIGAVPLVLLGAQRKRAVAAAAGAALAVGLAWLVVVTVAVPAAQRPWAIGSAHGSPWQAAFVYDGWARVAGARQAAPSAAAAARVPAAPGPLRLFSAQDGLGVRLGVALAAAWASVAVLVVTGRRRTAGLAALAAWLALGTVLFSFQAAMRPRYLEAFTPAVAACLALGVRVRGFRPVVAVVLAAGLVTSVAAVRAHVQDSGSPGALPTRRVAALSAYLRAHQHGARYEFASVLPSPAAPLIAADGRPVLVLSAAGHEIVSVGALHRLVATGQVRDALVPKRCSGAACASIRAHGTDVSRAAGEPHTGRVYAL